MPEQGRPLVTANQVTLARLIPMPLLSWLIYRGYELRNQGHDGDLYLWIALIAGTVIGCTDWVDGMLARKYGPTVLGGLLDPIADKVFVAFAYIPFCDNQVHLIPAWLCALMFVREFFITALRSAYEQRDLTLKTSYLAKVKTWTQMQGIGVMLLFPLMITHLQGLTWFLAALVITPLVVLAIRYVQTKKIWRGAIVMSGAVAPILALSIHGDMPLTILLIMYAVVALTWVSGFDYIFGGWKQLRGRGDFGLADGVRIIGAISVPCLCFAVLVETPAPAWPIFTIMAFELACGGLDNLLSHHKAATKALAWGGRVLGISALLAASLLLPSLATPLTAAAAILSVVGVAAEFWRGRDYFMDARIRDKSLRPATPET